MPIRQPVTTSQGSSPLRPGTFHFLGSAADPILEILTSRRGTLRLPLRCAGLGREAGEWLWETALPEPPAGKDWRFRIDDGRGGFIAPRPGRYFRTALRSLWLQDGQIFSYRPAPSVSPSRVVKIPAINGFLPPRPVYVYLPRGYDEHPTRSYPVLYMHDGQNVFGAFEADSFAGTWQADKTADRLIDQGLIRECLIVGVGNGGTERIAEYLPPDVLLRPRVDQASPASRATGKRLLAPCGPACVRGRADQTLAYYRDQVAPYLSQRFRILAGRDHTATCGSSMGGLFSLYIAWEHPGFARHHAALSPALGILRGQGLDEFLARLRTGPRRDIRLWLDSGTRDRPQIGDDDMLETRLARDALLENGYEDGPAFRYHLSLGAVHSEAAWAARLPQVLTFLFPAVE